VLLAVLGQWSCWQRHSRRVIERDHTQLVARVKAVDEGKQGGLGGEQPWACHRPGAVERNHQRVLRPRCLDDGRWRLQFQHHRDGVVLLKRQYVYV